MKEVYEEGEKDIYCNGCIWLTWDLLHHWHCIYHKDYTLSFNFNDLQIVTPDTCKSKTFKRGEL